MTRTYVMTLMAAAIAAFLTLESSAGKPFAGHEAIGEGELAAVRGGYRLPNGMSVDIGFRALTLVDGVPVLSTEIDFDAASLQPRTPVGDRVAGLTNGDPESAAAILSAAQDVFAYSGDGISVQHLAGQLTGQIILNSGSNRTIDTVTAIDVRIDGFQPHPVSSLSQFTSAIEQTARPITF